MGNSPVITRLDGGVAVVFSVPHTKSVAITVLVKAGPVNENPEERGASHLLEHLLGYTCGTPEGRLRDVIRKHGISDLNLETDVEFTLYQAEVRPASVADVLRAISYVLTYPNIRKLGSEYEHKKRVVELEISNNFDDSERMLNKTALKQLWGDHPLARTVSGSVNEVQQLAKENVAAYHKRRYVQSNMVISVAGDINQRAVIKQIEDLPWGISREVQSLDDIEVPNHNTLAEPYWENRHCYNTWVWIGTEAPPSSWETDIRFNCLGYLLCSASLGKYLWEIREKLCITYDISLIYHQFRPRGLAAIITGCPPGNENRLIQAVNEKLAHVREKGFTKTDVGVAKRLLRNELDWTWREPTEMSTFMAESLFYQPEIVNQGISKARIKRIIAGLNRDNLSQFASDLFREDKLSVIGLRPEHLR